MRIANPFADCPQCRAYGVRAGLRCAGCGISKGYPAAVARSAAPKPLAVTQRWAGEVAAVVSAHPAPEVAAREATFRERPGEAAQIAVAATRCGWGIRRAHYARGTDLGASDVVDSFVMMLGRPGAGLVMWWLARPPWVCAGCGTPRKPTAAGVVRKHGECPGGGQRPVQGDAEAVWEFGRAWPGPLESVTAVMTTIKGEK